jgi:hypothetical protein
MCVRRPYTEHLMKLSPKARMQIPITRVWPQTPKRIDPGNIIFEKMRDRDDVSRHMWRGVFAEAMSMHAYMPPRQAHDQVSV